MMIETCFWISLIGAVYSYFIYPLILVLLPKQKIATGPSDKLPYLSLIITAHNEEHRIREKLENTLALDYPNELKEILVASDGSTDQTNQIVEAYADKGVKLVHVKERKGKENAQLAAIQAAQGEILVNGLDAQVDAVARLIDLHRPAVKQDMAGVRLVDSR